MLAKKMAVDFIFLQMVMFMKANLIMAIDKVKEAILGSIKATIRVNG